MYEIWGGSVMTECKCGAVRKPKESNYWPVDCPACGAPVRSERRRGGRRHTCKRCSWCTGMTKEWVTKSEQHNSFQDSAFRAIESLKTNVKGIINFNNFSNLVTRLGHRNKTKLKMTKVFVDKKKTTSSQETSYLLETLWTNSNETPLSTNLQY